MSKAEPYECFLARNKRRYFVLKTAKMRRDKKEETKQD